VNQVFSVTPKSPCLKIGEGIFLKIILSSRNATQNYLGGKTIMSDALLKKHLGNLHTELKNTYAMDDTVDEETAKLLQEIMKDVRVLLSHQGSEPTIHHATIKGRLGEYARHFDVSHPSLASTMRTVVSTLNNMGI
jgi:hypothetical protein